MSSAAARLSPQQLLAGPRGRRLLLLFAVESERATLSGESRPLGRSVFAASYRLAKLDGDPVFLTGAGAERLDADHVPGALPEDVAQEIAAVPLVEPSPALVRACLVRSVEAAAYWQQPDGDDLLAATAPVAEALGRVADLLAAAPGAAWLAGGATGLHWLLRRPETDEEPRPSAVAALARWSDELLADEREFRSYLDSAPDFQYSGFWASTPPEGLPSTCGTMFDGSPSALWFFRSALGLRRVSAYRVDAPSSARTLTIDGPTRWAELCRDYPLTVTATVRQNWGTLTGRDGRWVIPDWSRIAEHHDAVHLTYAGYLSTAGVPIPVDDDTASLIAGWNPDATYWLTDIAETGASVSWRSLGDTGEPQWIIDGE